MTKTYDLGGRVKGPPKISKLDTINKTLNRVTASFEALDKDNDGNDMMNVMIDEILSTFLSSRVMVANVTFQRWVIIA